VAAVALGASTEWIRACGTMASPPVRCFAFKSEDPRGWWLERRAAPQGVALRDIAVQVLQRLDCVMADVLPPTRLIPALLLNLRDHYTALHFRKDALAGLMVAIVALPLSMASPPPAPLPALPPT
jgi:hypothetical protein